MMTKEKFTNVVSFMTPGAGVLVLGSGHTSGIVKMHNFFKVVWDTLPYLQSNYNHSFKNFKICKICPQNAFVKLIKSKTGARFKPTTHRLVACPLRTYYTRHT